MHNSKLLSWAKLSTINLGGMICLPMIGIGHLIGKKHDFVSAFGCIVLGNVILLLLSLTLGKLSFQLKKSPIEICALYLSKTATKMIAVIFFLASMLWFAIQLDAITLSIMETWHFEHHLLLNACIGMSFTLFLLKGIERLSTIADYSLPILFAFLVYLTCQIFLKSDLPLLSSVSTSEGSISFGGVSLVLGASLLGIIDLPTYYCLGKTKNSATVCSVVTVLGGLSIIELIGVLLAVKFPTIEFQNCFDLFGTKSGKELTILFFFLAGWTTSNSNLYTGAICLRQLLTQVSENKRILLTGLFATFVACTPLLCHMEHLLTIIAIFIAAVGGIICMRAALLVRQNYYFNAVSKMIHLAIVLAGVSLGAATYGNVFVISGSSVLDSFLTVVVLCLLLSILNFLYSLFVKVFSSQKIRQYRSAQDCSIS